MTVSDEYKAVESYDNGQLGDDEVLTLFQHLIDTGREDCYEGYKVIADALVEHGLLKPRFRGLTLILGGLHEGDSECGQTNHT